MAGALQDRVAVVTGAGGGFGRVLALAIAAEGAHVLVVDHDAAGAQTSVDSILAAGGSAEVVVADVVDDADTERVMQRAADLGGLHVLVNNAGGWTPADAQFPEVEATRWSHTLDLDLRAPMAWTQRVLTAPRAAGGRVVVNISSSAALGPAPYGSPEYAVAKAGLVRLTTSLADAGDRFGTRVLCVVPGWIGLERAHAALAELSVTERAATPDLVPPDFLAATIVDAIADHDVASGTVLHALAGDGLVILPPTA